MDAKFVNNRIFAMYYYVTLSKGWIMDFLDFSI